MPRDHHVNSELDHHSQRMKSAHRTGPLDPPNPSSYSDVCSTNVDLGTAENQNKIYYTKYASQNYRQSTAAHSNSVIQSDLNMELPWAITPRRSQEISMEYSTTRTTSSNFLH
ncbi:hypothetical protein AVEN_254322-1 [Araneus ventricosus]|uniref:Uncharacterized protein n=1 Tax=Araneus ventricosus TaxID=182803 RepID=A0A4Y2P7Y5_ARAVE|nr:hypothetical protein AVEN_254322-1 [Araneus ventricosus]